MAYLLMVEGFVTSFDFSLVYIPLVNQFCTSSPFQVFIKLRCIPALSFGGS
jgi:hypothetical protein